MKQRMYKKELYRRHWTRKNFFVVKLMGEIGKRLPLHSKTSVHVRATNRQILLLKWQDIISPISRRKSLFSL